jgi:hypothetical protein
MWQDPDLGQSSEQLKKERYTRIHAAQTKLPDRVPVTCNIANFSAKQAGVFCSDAC